MGNRATIHVVYLSVLLQIVHDAAGAVEHCCCALHTVFFAADGTPCANGPYPLGAIAAGNVSDAVGENAQGIQYANMPHV